MPGSSSEHAQLAMTDPFPEDLAGQCWQDGSVITVQDVRNVRALWRFHQQQQRHQLARRRGYKAQCRALRTLREYLSPVQLIQLRQSGRFLIILSSGNTYRLDARWGSTTQVVRHGCRWFVYRRFCLHDDRAQFLLPLPPADMALSHLLLLLADEQEFLRLANATDVRTTLWDGQWLRRLRAARITTDTG